MTENVGVLAVGIAAIATFALAFQVSGLVARARGVVAVVSETLAVIRQTALDDATKERLIQRATRHPLRNCPAITLTSLPVPAARGGVIWTGGLLSLAPVAAVYDFLLAWNIIIGASLALLVVGWVLS